MIYTVTFNPALDCTVWVENLKKGSVNHASREEIFCGGKGINVSIMLRELGFDSTALGFIAGFTGDELERRLKKSGIHTDFIKLNGGNTRINVKIRSDSETDLNLPGPDISRDAVNQLFLRLDTLKSGDVLVLAGSIPSTVPQDIYERIMAYLDGRGVMIAVDATGKLLKSVLKYHPFLIKPNHTELEEIAGRRILDDDGIIKAANELRAAGAENVLVSMAQDGAILVDKNGEIRKLGAVPCKEVNSVGAGDSMVAGFIAGFIKTDDYTYALKLGTAAGGATASDVGLGTRERIEELLELL